MNLSDGILSPWETKQTSRVLTKELIHINLVVLVLVLKKPRRQMPESEEHILYLISGLTNCLEPVWNLGKSKCMIKSLKATV